MNREYRAAVDIAAGTDRVWTVLTNLEAYHRWNPFILDGSGVFEEGRNIRIRFRLHSGLIIPARPKIIKVEAFSELSWVGHLLTPALIWGMHRFLLEAVRPGITRLTQWETYGGALLPLVWWHLKRDAEAGFHAMNHALKDLLEHGAGGVRGFHP